MLHCGGGPGPNSFDTLTALESWVEHDIVPDTIVATKYINDNPALGVAKTMPLCAFPAKARHEGGDVNRADSWSCRPRDRSMLKARRNGVEAGVFRRAGTSALSINARRF